MTRDPSLALALPADALTAFVELLHAQRELADAGRTWPCQIDPEPFTSDSRDERAEAAEACAGCPLLEPCGRYADAAEERHHVWAGVDRVPPPRTKRQKERSA